MEMEQQDSTDWDFAADLDFTKSWLRTKSTTGTERTRARNFISACVKLARNSDAGPSNGQMLRECTGNARRNGMLFPSRNPLEMEDILTELLHYIPMSSLLTCRLVNHTWNERAVSRIRKTQELVEVKFFDIVRFSTDFEKTVVFPFSKLSLVLGNVNVSLEDYSKSFIKHGSHIRRLKICESKSKTPKNKMSSRRNLQQLKCILKHVPNLTSISLDLQVIPDLSDLFNFNYVEAEHVVLHQVESLELKAVTSLSKRFMNSLFTMLPNVKELGSILLAKQQDLEALTEAFQKLKLLSISLPSCFTPIGLLPALGHTQKLKVISLVLETKRRRHGATELVRAQEELLGSQAEYLENLNLLYHDNSEKHSALADELTLPVMKNLKTLSLHLEEGYNCDPNHYPLAQLHPRQVPKLEILSIEPELLKLFANSTFTTVREVAFFDDGQSDNCDELESIASMFPNLRKLTGLCIDINDNYGWMASAAFDDQNKESQSRMNLIVKALVNVEELELKLLHDTHPGEMNVNFFISGVPMQNSWLLDQVAGRLGVCPSIEPPGSSLRDLKRLTSLKLSFSCDGGKMRISINEVGVYWTFLRLSPRLRLTLEGDFTIRSDLAAKLTDYFQNICLNPNPCTLAVNADSD